MAKCWYETSVWTDEDEKKLAGRLKRYKTPYDRIQTLRIKALHMMKSGDCSLHPVCIRLLNLAIRDPELSNCEIDKYTRGELILCHRMLGEFAEFKGDRQEAELHYRKEIELSTTKEGVVSSSVLNTGMRLAVFLSQEDDREKLLEADRLLDQLKDSEVTLQLAFRQVKLWYCVAKARIYLKLGRRNAAKDFARAALELYGAKGIDSFKGKPMDRPLLDETTQNEMRNIYES